MLSAPQFSGVYYRPRGDWYDKHRYNGEWHDLSSHCPQDVANTFDNPVPPDRDTADIDSFDIVDASAVASDMEQDGGTAYAIHAPAGAVSKDGTLIDTDTLALIVTGFDLMDLDGKDAGAVSAQVKTWFEKDGITLRGPVTLTPVSSKDYLLDTYA